MNCDEFGRTIIDFDGEALKHAESCEHCGARLKREERLTAGIRSLAVEESKINAPEKVRSALRAAFDEQLGASSRPVELRSPHRKIAWGLAAAATLLFSLLITAPLWLRRHKPAAMENVQLASPPNLSGGAAAAEPEGQMQRAIRVDFPQDARLSGTRRRRHRHPVTRNADDPGGFFPLTYVAKSLPTESVQTVHVEILRSTLLTLGVPVNIDRGEGLIKAEIIIGEDGVARAVRIIN